MCRASAKHVFSNKVKNRTNLMQSLAGNKYVPRLGQIGCESDGWSVIKFRNITSGLISSSDFSSLGGKRLKLGTVEKFLLIYFFAATTGCQQELHILNHTSSVLILFTGEMRLKC